MNKTLGWFIIIAVVALASCSSGNSGRQEDGADTLQLSYARLLNIVEYEGYKVVEIADPWKSGAVLHRYILTSDLNRPHLPEGTIVKVPIKNAGVFTTVHASMMVDMGVEDRISGMADVQYVKRKEIKSLIDSKRITDVGSNMSPDIEKIISLSPEAILLSPFENSGGYGKLDQLGIPIIECAEYMETSPLARAEWIKFYGMLFGMEKEANKMFADTEARYKALIAEAKNMASHPKVLIDMPMGNTWYVPGGESTLGRMITDAGGRYCFAGDKNSGSVALSLEKVVSQCEDADLWLFRYGGEERTLADFAADNSAFTHIKAFKDGNVYGCSTERTTFYESTPFHPDRLLEDFIAMIHPQTKRTTTYFKKLR